MSDASPVFAVVGRVNRGKSSIVSTLAADESVAIEARPGTTRSNRAYPMRVGQRTLYTLVDTPGFERARHVLAWLREHETHTADRAQVVRRFVREHQASGQFPQECELLRPILDGAAILYVVDGSVPFSPAYEAETEILRWTGQPRMALINSIGGSDHHAEWRAVLDQYFSLVRDFDAHQADFEARIELLRALRELAVPWKTALDEAVALLIQDRRRRIHACTERVADALCELLATCEELRLPPDADPLPHRAKLTDRFYERLRKRETRLHAELRRQFLHERLNVTQEDLDRVDEDLFATSTWSRLGLTRHQLAMTGAATGALMGGSLDLALGGTSLLAGAAIGGALGWLSTYAAWQPLASTRVLGASLGGKLLRAGPIRDPNFGWIVLDRALLFFTEVARHPHARRDRVVLGHATSRVQELTAAERKPIDRLFARIRAHPDDAGAQAVARDELVGWLEPQFARAAHFSSATEPRPGAAPRPGEGA